MAKFGSTEVKVTSWDTLRFYWSIQSQNVPNNSSVITWMLTLDAGSSGQIISSAGKSWSVTVNGTKYGGMNTVGVENYASKTLASGTTTIPHNADGTKTFSYSFSQNFGITFSGQSIGTISGSGSGALDAIPRGTSIVKAPNFSDADIPVLTYTNPAGTAVTSLEACISITGANDDVPYRAIPTNRSQYTFNLTTAERNTLRAAVTKGTSTTVWFYVKGTIGSFNFSDKYPVTFSLSKPNPVVTLTAQDVSDVTYELTGRRDFWIEGYSNVQYQVTATAAYGATITDYRVSANGHTTLYAPSATFTGIKAETITATVTDSRGNATTTTYTAAHLIPYGEPTAYVTSLSLTGTGILTVNVEGHCFRNSFGARDNSCILQYRYKATDGSSTGAWTTLEPVYDEEYKTWFSAAATVSGLDYRKGYKVECKITDLLSSETSESHEVRSQPIFDWGETDFHLNVPLYLQEGNNIKFRTEEDEILEAVAFNSPSTLTIGQGFNAYGITEVVGNKVGIFSNKGVFIDGYEYGKNKVLWSGGEAGYQMNANQTATLSEKITSQPHGIVLVFSYYEPSTGYAQNTGWSTHFVPKQMVHLNDGGGQSFLLGLNAGFSLIGAKYLYISDTAIKGQSSNTSVGTNSGISFKNDQFVLRYVIGV